MEWNKCGASFSWKAYDLLGTFLILPKLQQKLKKFGLKFFQHSNECLHIAMLQSAEDTKISTQECYHAHFYPVCFAEWHNVVYTSVYSGARGVTRLDGARGRKQVWRPHVRTWDVSEVNVVYWRKYLWHCWDFSAPPAVIRRTRSDSVAP